jgi:hypothetical protein
MPRMGFEPTIPAFGQQKTVHILDRTATVVGIQPPTYARHHTIVLAGILCTVRSVRHKNDRKFIGCHIF